MYARTFGTDWERIESRDEAVRRAYALGVATRLGETHPDELDRLVEQTGTTYERSFVDLAYQKGRDEAGDVRRQLDAEAVWEELVEGKTVIDPWDRPTPDPDDPHEADDDVTTIPDALRIVDIDVLPDDSTERVRRPPFLDGIDRDRPTTARSDDRTVFGRSVEVGRNDSEGADPGDASRDDRGEDEGDGTDV